jgi:hypothetical protein
MKNLNWPIIGVMVFWIVVFVAILSLVGCSGIIVNKFDDTGKMKKRVIITSSMVKMDFKRLSVQTEDVNVVIEKYNQEYDPNSWVLIGRGVAAGSTGGTSEIAKEALK